MTKAATPMERRRGQECSLAGPQQNDVVLCLARPQQDDVALFPLESSPIDLRLAVNALLAPGSVLHHR
jgi:hypothetical protein